MRGNHGIERSMRCKFVGCCDKGIRGKCRDFIGDFKAEVDGRVQTSAHRRSARGKFVEPRQRLLYPGKCIAHLRCVSRPLLFKRESNRILKTGTANQFRFILRKIAGASIHERQNLGEQAYSSHRFAQLHG